MAPANALAAARAAAREVAACALESRGFVLQNAPDEHWTGTLFLPDSGVTIPISVRLPQSFPDALPKVAVPQQGLTKRIAHVERSGNICLVLTSNVLIDGDRPEDLVEEALRRATEVLDRGLLGKTDPDLDLEFQAYWEPTDFTVMLSHCDVDGPARKIVICQLIGGSKLIEQGRILSDHIEDLKIWAERVGAKVGAFNYGLFIPVSTSVPLAPPGEPTTVSQVTQLIRHHGSRLASKLFGRALQSSDYPLFLAFSMPEAALGGGRRLAAVRIERPNPKLLRAAGNGFRPGKAPPSQILNWMGRAAVDRINLKRADMAYLLTRGGAATGLEQAIVTIVGIGAVGSEVARNLAAIGVGKIFLVDPDSMEVENVHRHALGMSSTGYSKALALGVELSRNFPHLSIDFRPVAVEALLESEPALLLEADLLVLATGEETLERRLNRLLQGGPPRVHTWLEPLGIGGHTFACGGSDFNSPSNGAAVGCLECLYRPDDVFGLVNRTAFTAPGQEIRRSLAGCAGNFSPFSPLDARRTAVDAAEVIARVLKQKAPSTLLVSWRGMHTDFEAGEYKLSGRASQVARGARIEVSGADLVRDDCQVCGIPGLAATSVVEGG